MKIIHEIGSKPQTMAILKPFIGPCAERPRWRSARVEIEIFSGEKPSEKEPWEEEEPPLCITGDLKDVREALQDALDMLDSLEYIHKEDIAQVAEYSSKCTVCGTWYDTRRPIAWGHSDGRGHLCVCDGTAYMRECKVTLVDGEEIPFRDLKREQGFLCVHDTDEGTVYEVVREPFEHYDGYTTTFRVAVLRHP